MVTMETDTSTCYSVMIFYNLLLYQFNSSKCIMWSHFKFSYRSFRKSTMIPSINEYTCFPSTRLDSNPVKQVIRYRIPDELAHCLAIPCVCVAENIPLVIASLTEYDMVGWLPSNTTDWLNLVMTTTNITQKWVWARPKEFVSYWNTSPVHSYMYIRTYIPSHNLYLCWQGLELFEYLDTLLVLKQNSIWQLG